MLWASFWSLLKSDFITFQTKFFLYSNAYEIPQVLNETQQIVERRRTNDMLMRWFRIGESVLELFQVLCATFHVICRAIVGQPNGFTCEREWVNRVRKCHLSCCIKLSAKLPSVFWYHLSWPPNFFKVSDLCLMYTVGVIYAVLLKSSSFEENVHEIPWRPSYVTSGSSLAISFGFATLSFRELSFLSA